MCTRSYPHTKNPASVETTLFPLFFSTSVHVSRKSGGCRTVTSDVSVLRKGAEKGRIATIKTKCTNGWLLDPPWVHGSCEESPKSKANKYNPSSKARIKYAANAHCLPNAAAVIAQQVKLKSAKSPQLPRTLNNDAHRFCYRGHKRSHTRT